MEQNSCNQKQLDLVFLSRPIRYILCNECINKFDKSHQTDTNYESFEKNQTNRLCHFYKTTKKHNYATCQNSMNAF